MEPVTWDYKPDFAGTSPEKPAASSGVLERCFSPLSQASTAPPTPSCLGELPKAIFGRAVSGQSDASGQSTKGSEEANIDDLLQLIASPHESLEEWEDVVYPRGPHFDCRARTLETEYLVDNSKLKATTIGLAYRNSKQLQDRNHSVRGPCWGTTVMGVDQGDGWLKVGEHFLPMCLDGAPVLAAFENAAAETEALWDGPALTADGRAVDLDDGALLFFSHAKELSSGYLMACKLKEEAHLLRSARLAHSACEAEARLEAGEACSIDPAGVVRGAAALWPPLAGTRATDGARRRLARRRAAAAAARSREDSERLVLCADEKGKVSLYLPLPSGTAGRAERVRQRQAAACRWQQELGGPGVLLVASASGYIGGCRRADKLPRVLPARGAARAAP